jgi:5-hydroxyisourate hydrolase
LVEFLQESAMPGSGRLTTHVLDTMHGKPAAGMRIDLLMAHGDHTHHVLTVETNADGRVDEPLLGEGRWAQGTFELVFHVGQYFARLGGGPTAAPFLDTVPVRFQISEDAHYHVPLLVSPYAYSTYRGS